MNVRAETGNASSSNCQEQETTTTASSDQTSLGKELQLAQLVAGYLYLEREGFLVSKLIQID